MLFPKIQAFIERLPNPELSEERAQKWEALASRIRQNNKQGALDFICTHNARRSALSQSLGAAIAHHLQLDQLKFWSGGAEVTYIHPNTITALQEIGFHLINKEGEKNPVYQLSYSEEAPPLVLFSKKFDDESTPAPYHAILVCSKGDKACPFIPQVASRTLIPFEDPGHSDGTAKAAESYRKAAIEIGSELNYFLHQVCLRSQD